MEQPTPAPNHRISLTITARWATEEMACAGCDTSIWQGDPYAQVRVAGWEPRPMCQTCICSWPMVDNALAMG